MSGLKVLVADDHALVREAVMLALQDATAPRQIVEASSFSTLATALQTHPDVALVLLDLTMPGARGFSSLVHLRGEYPALPVVVLSSNDQPKVIRRAQQFGAAGFISKSSRLGGIREAVNRVLDGDCWFPPLLAERSAADAELAERLALLTPAQLRVLWSMADGLLNKQIAADLGMAENTVKVHVTAVLKKLGCNSRTQAALLVKALEQDEAGDDGLDGPVA